MMSWMSGATAVVFVSMVTGCSSIASAPALIGDQAAAAIVLPNGISGPDRVCEPLGSIPSPDGRWTAILRRAEWDQPGFRIPYLLTELWVVERRTGVRRRLLDHTHLASDWSSRFSPESSPSGRAGGFTFREMSWSPSSRAIALEDAGDEWRFRGTVIVDVEAGRILELAGGGLAWSPDGSRAALCRGSGFDCPNGILIVDVARGEVRDELAGMNVIEYGWHASNVPAVLGYVRDQDRYGWWVLDDGKPGAQLRPTTLRPVPSPSAATTTWWEPEPSGRLPCVAERDGLSLPGTENSSARPAGWWQDILYDDPPTDRQLERHVGETIMVTFRWGGSSSILHSTMVIGELRGFDDETLKLATSDGKDGACMPEAYWKLLVEYGRAAADADHQCGILVSRELVDVILRTEPQECR